MLSRPHHNLGRHLTDIAGLLVLLASGPSIPLEAQEPAAALDDAIATITSGTVLGHLEFLAADALRGRDTPSPGLAAAADYLETYHGMYGLEPAGGDGEFLQPYPYRLMAPDPASARVTLVSGSREVELEMGRDAFLDGAASDPLDASLTLVRWSDGARPTPGSLEGAVAVFALSGDWDQPLWQRSLEQSAYAREAGAVATIHVLDAEFRTALVPQLSEALAEPAWRLGGDAFSPRIFATIGSVRPVLPVDEPGWSGDPAPTGSVVEVPLDGTRLRADVPARVVQDGDPPNVVARLPGSDPALQDEHVVLSAHFDHVGIGDAVQGDSIYNGADDNGSGTSALLEVARVLASLPEDARPGRSVIFVHVSGEEKGLLGSRWWVDHPTVPLSNVVANLNVDMIGGDTHPDTVAALGREYSSLGPAVAQVVGAHPELGITTVGDLWPGERLFFRSDQYNFMSAGIPSLFFFAGFHDCYHRPCDEVDFVNPDKVARVARLLAYTVVKIANAEERPRWDPEGWAEVERLTSGG